jgi:high-affinity nickel permease
MVVIVMLMIMVMVIICQSNVDNLLKCLRRARQLINTSLKGALRKAIGLMNNYK